MTVASSPWAHRLAQMLNRRVATRLRTPAQQQAPVPHVLQEPSKHAKSKLSYTPRLGRFGIPPAGLETMPFPAPPKRQAHGCPAGSALPGTRPSEEGAVGPPAARIYPLLQPSHLRATAACAGQALPAVGSSAAMCFELFPPNLLRGPVQALMMHSPEPRPLQEKLSQYYSLGESISQKSLKQGSDLSSSGCASP